MSALPPGTREGEGRIHTPGVPKDTRSHAARMLSAAPHLQPPPAPAPSGPAPTGPARLGSPGDRPQLLTRRLSQRGGADADQGELHPEAALPPRGPQEPGVCCAQVCSAAAGPSAARPSPRPLWPLARSCPGSAGLLHRVPSALAQSLWGAAPALFQGRGAAARPGGGQVPGSRLGPDSGGRQPGGRARF